MSLPQMSFETRIHSLGGLIKLTAGDTFRFPASDVAVMRERRNVQCPVAGIHTSSTRLGSSDVPLSRPVLLKLHNAEWVHRWQPLLCFVKLYVESRRKIKSIAPIVLCRSLFLAFIFGSKLERKDCVGSHI